MFIISWNRYVLLKVSLLDDKLVGELYSLCRNVFRTTVFLLQRAHVIAPELLQFDHGQNGDADGKNAVDAVEGASDAAVDLK